MKRINKDIGKRVAYAGIGGAISLMFVTLSYFVDMFTITLQAAAAVGVIVPITKKYFREAGIMVLAVSGISFFIVNLNCLLFLFISGGFTYLTLLLSEKKVKYYITLIGKIIYANLVFLLFYKGVKLLGLDFSRLSEYINTDLLSPAIIYIVLDLIFCFVILVWDWIVLYLFKYIEKRIPNK